MPTHLAFVKTTAAQTLMLCVGICCLLASGCAMFETDEDLGFLDQPGNSSMPQSARYQVVVESQWSDGKPKTFTMSEPLTVQEALVEARAIRQFGKIEVEVIRLNPQTNQIHRMPVGFDSRNKQVRDEQNYAVFANDRIVVRHLDSSPIDHMVDAIGFNGH